MDEGSSTELSLLKDKSKSLNQRLDDSLFAPGIAPHFMQLASKLANSSLVPKSYQGKPADLFLCWALGYKKGLDPEQSMQCIAIINGRATMWGDDMLALCMNHPEFEDIIEEPMIKDGATFGYRCTIKRKGKKPTVNEFTLDMAKKAGLLAKGGVWSQYPERMLKLRARGFTLRDSFPDALNGIKPREEIEDYIDAEYSTVESKESRTETLKNDFLTKTGKENDKNMDNSVEASTNFQYPRDPGDEDNPEKEKKTGSKTADLYSKIEQCKTEGLLTEEAYQRYLKFYEVSNIEELAHNAVQHFMGELDRLVI